MRGSNDDENYCPRRSFSFDAAARSERLTVCQCPAARQPSRRAPTPTHFSPDIRIDQCNTAIRKTVAS
jgi:hypothetical protein